MTLSFPNPSRSYDAVAHRVRFWGYDRAMEVSFFVEENALSKLQPRMGGVEEDILRAFDGARERILSVAAAVYAKGRRNPFILAEADF